MWFFIYLFKAQVNIKKLKSFIFGFIFLFFLSPIFYTYISISKDNKRTDYEGKIISKKIQYKWNENFNEPINVVLGNEWDAGNLSYHLKSRPTWIGLVTKDKLNSLSKFICIDNVCVGYK